MHFLRIIALSVAIAIFLFPLCNSHVLLTYVYSVYVNSNLIVQLKLVEKLPIKKSHFNKIVIFLTINNWTFTRNNIKPGYN
jgi:hypothetical protein